jgi:uncharacterized protein (DUF1800 family)
VWRFGAALSHRCISNAGNGPVKRIKRISVTAEGTRKVTNAPASIEAAIALNRFGLGARPGELARLVQAAMTGPRYLLDQLNDPASALIVDPALLSAPAAFQAYSLYRQQRRTERQQATSATPMQAGPQPAEPMPGQPMEAAQRELQQQANRTLGAETSARIHKGLDTDQGFLERWVLFWSNHFTMAASGGRMVPFAGPFEREAVRPHVLGRFSDLLFATSTHPGMLVYLDQAQSVGPNSLAANRASRNGRNRGLNENLAREILELHTVGAQGGYSQTDVTEFARALTGWTIATGMAKRLAPDAPEGSALFLPQLHEPGSRIVMSRSYGQSGSAQARAILSDLASHPATARRIATKVATHFVADAPPPALVARLEASFNQTGGDLAALARTLVESPESWAATPAKFKSPNDFLLSSLRAAGIRAPRLGALRDSFAQLGQAPFRAASPEGWPDDAASWAGPDAVLKRVDWANQFATRLPASLTGLALAETALGATLGTRTRTAISRAETPQQAITLALMSPEFQRR